MVLEKFCVALCKVQRLKHIIRLNIYFETLVVIISEEVQCRTAQVQAATEHNHLKYRA